MSIIAVTIDSREPLWVQTLAFGAPVATVTMLDHGDLLAVTDDQTVVAVERKTADDLLGSIRDGRLWPQLAGMRRQTPWSYLVITGTMAASGDGKVITDRGVTGWLWSSVQGALLKVQELGVMVVQAANDADYEPTVVRLSARSHTPEMVIEPRKEPSILSEAERILTAMPGVGLERVAAICEYCGTVGWALTMLTDTAQHGDHIPGVGPGIKRQIRNALGLRDNEALSVIYADSGMPVIKGGNDHD